MGKILEVLVLILEGSVLVLGKVRTCPSLNDRNIRSILLNINIINICQNQNNHSLAFSISVFIMQKHFSWSSQSMYIIKMICMTKKVCLSMRQKNDVNHLHVTYFVFLFMFMVECIYHS